MARGRGSPTGTMDRGSSIGGGFLGFILKGMICLSAMGTRRGASLLLERGGFDGMALEEAEAHLYRGEKLPVGAKIYP